MYKKVYEQRLPYVSIVMDMSSSKDDAEEAAYDLILNVKGIKHFEILHVEMVEEGKIRSKDGAVTGGRRYVISFRHLYGEVIFTHPDYDRIMNIR